MKTGDAHLERMRHEHARWSTEHGHWTKDVLRWSEEHEKVLSALSNAEAMVHKFEELLPPFRRDIALHDEEVRLHATELADAVPGSKHPGEELHKCGEVGHEREREAHAELRSLHEHLIAEIERLKIAVPFSPHLEATVLGESVEQTPEI